jgi:hypothetical protein
MPASGENNSASRKNSATNAAVRPVAAAGRDAGRAFDVAGGGRGADHRAEHGGKAIGISACRIARQVAVLVEQAGAVGDSDQRAALSKMSTSRN